MHLRSHYRLGWRDYSLLIVWGVHVSNPQEGHLGQNIYSNLILNMRVKMLNSFLFFFCIPGHGRPGMQGIDSLNVISLLFKDKNIVLY